MNVGPIFPVYRNTATGVAYVGSKICAGCHQKNYEEYVHTAMGRSMSLANDQSELKRVPLPVSIFDNKINRYFQVFSEGSNLYQTEYELDRNGDEVFKHTEKVEYVIGFGVNGLSYVIRRGGYLFQAPLSFYSKPKTWGLSPGYESQDYGFSRPILSACMVCHSGRPQPVPQRDGLYADPPFRELAIGCENCHGPGQLHVEDRLQGVAVSGDVDRSIVNPAKLPPWLADNICMYCHQGGDVRVLKPGKDYSDFRPGTPLDDTLAIFKVPLKRDLAPLSPLLEHHFSMVLSKCYRESGGRLSCLTCHNPHHEPSPQEAAAHYRKRCLTCHAEKNCALPYETRLRENPPNDCAGCHMPKQEVQVIAHSSLTDHRIVSHKGKPYPEIAFHPASPAVPNLIYLNATPDKENVAIPPLTLLQAYIELIKHSHIEYQGAYLSHLNQIAKTEPKNTLVLAALAQKALWERTPQGKSAAIQYLSQAIESGSTSPSDYLLLAELLAQSGRVPEAIKVLKRGITLAPYTSLFYRSLALRYLSVKRSGQALEAMKQGLQLFPEDSILRMLMKKAEAAALAP